MEIDLIRSYLEKSYSSLNNYKLEINLKETFKGMFNIKIFLNKVEVENYNLDLKILCCYDGKIELPKNLKGKGLGRKLVEGRESVCKMLKFRFLIINNNQNTSFWKHIGYKLVPEDLIDYLDRARPNIFMNISQYEPPLFKETS